MDSSNFITLLITAGFSILVSLLGSKKLSDYKADQNKSDIDKLEIRLAASENNHHGLSRLLAKMEVQVENVDKNLTSLNAKVDQIHERMFDGQST